MAQNFQVFSVQDLSPAAPGVGYGIVIPGLSKFDTLDVIVELTGATGGSLDVAIESGVADTAGTSIIWYEWARCATVVAAAPLVCRRFNSLALPLATTVGKSLTTTFVLAVDTEAGGHPGERIRLRMVANAGTSAAALQTLKVVGYFRANPGGH